MTTTTQAMIAKTKAKLAPPEIVEAAKRDGQQYTPAPRPSKFPKGAPHDCFTNAAEFAASNPGYQYVEGIVVPADLPENLPDDFGDVFVHHAWVARTGDDAAIDVTLDAPATEYIGIPLTADGPRLTVGLRGNGLKATEKRLLRASGQPQAGQVKTPANWPGATPQRPQHKKPGRHQQKMRRKQKHRNRKKGK